MLTVAGQIVELLSFLSFLNSHMCTLISEGNTCYMYFLVQEHSYLKWPLKEIYNLIFEHLTYSAIWFQIGTLDKNIFPQHIFPRILLKLSEVVKRMLA